MKMDYAESQADPLLCTIEATVKLSCINKLKTCQQQRELPEPVSGLNCVCNYLAV